MFYSTNIIVYVPSIKQLIFGPDDTRAKQILVDSD